MTYARSSADDPKLNLHGVVVVSINIANKIKHEREAIIEKKFLFKIFIKFKYEKEPMKKYYKK